MLIVALLLALLLTTLLLHLGARVSPSTGVTRMFGRVPWLPTHDFEPSESGLSFTVRVGTRTVRGTRFAASSHANRRAVVVYCHEFNGNRWGVAPHLKSLRAAGYDVVSFDFHGHGTSDAIPQHTPTPWPTASDVDDLVAVIEDICGPGEAVPLGLLGEGKGALTALATAAMDPRVTAVVADGVYLPRPGALRYDEPVGQERSSRPGWPYVLRRLWQRPRELWRRFVLGRNHACRFVDVERLAERIAQPVLIIHGQNDAYAALTDLRAFSARIAGSVRLWVASGAGHLEAVGRDPNRYHGRLVRFLKRTLDSPSPKVPSVAPASRPAGEMSRPQTVAVGR